MKRQPRFILTVTLPLVVGFSGLVSATEPRKENEIRKLVAALGQPDWRGAADGLVAAGEPAVTPLAKTLRDRTIKTWAIQVRAVDILARIGTRQATDAIVDCLHDTQCSEYVRGFAASALTSTDPITIAFIFGLRSIAEIESAFPGRLHEVLNTRFGKGGL